MSEEREIIQILFEIDQKEKNKPFSYTKYGYVLLLAGIIILYTSYAGFTGRLYLLGGALIVVGLFLIFKKLNLLFDFSEYKYPDDDEIKEYFLNDVDDMVLNRACFLHGIKKDEINKKYLIKILNIDRDIEDINEITLSDGSIIVSDWKVSLFVFGKHSLFYYKCKYNWVENVCVSEITNEFYYENIASIKTEIIEEDMLNTKEKLTITNVSGDKIECEIISDSENIPAEFKMDSENVLGKMRQIIRRKRYGEKYEGLSDEVDFEIIDKRRDE